MIRAFLFAKATVAMFLLRRHISWLSQSLRLSVLLWQCLSTERDQWISNVRKYLSPRLLIPPRRSLPPVEY